MADSIKKVLENVARIAERTAEKAAGTASFFGYHQPREPEMLGRMNGENSMIIY